MRFEDERYVRIFVRDTTTVLMLSWEARAVMWETYRKLDRAGILDLGEDGLEALAVTIRTPIDVVERGVAELLRRKVFELRGSLLISPRFVEAQEAKASDKARAKAARERARDAARARTAGVDVPPASDSDGADVNNTNRNAVDTPRDDLVPPRDETVTAGHTASHDVTLCCAVPSRAGEEHSQASTPPPAVGTPTAKPKRQPKGTRLPEDWQPSPELVEKLRRELRVDPFACLRRFRNYWLNATRNAVKPRWDLAFENWVARDAEDGKLPKLDEADMLPLLRLPDRDKYIPKPGEALDVEEFMRTGDLG